MTLRPYQIKTLALLAILLLGTPWVTFAGGAVAEFFWGVVVAFFGLFLYFAGSLLDIAVNTFVIGFGTQFISSGIGATVNALWVTVRDIFNLTFIFGLVFIGFKMILNSDDSNTRRWLVSLLLAALFVNFSLYITKFIVDFTNILATQIANAMPSSAGTAGGVAISESFMNQLGIQGIFAVAANDLPPGVEGAGAFGFIFGTMILFIVMTFVFGAGAFLLLIRYAVLLIYMILSPLMFLGWVFPQLQRYSSQYWQGFLGRAFFAPLYLLMVYFALRVISALYSSTPGGTQFVNTFTGSGGQPVPTAFSSTFPPFILTCVFLIAAIVIAQKLGGQSAQAVIGMSKKLTGKAYAGTTAWAGRKIIGSTGNKIAENKKVQQWARRKGLVGLAGRSLADVGHKARTSSFDARNASVGGATLAQTLGAGGGKKGGYAADKKAKDQKEQERAKRYSTQEDDQFYKDAGETVEQIKDLYDEILTEMNQTMVELSEETDPEKRKKLLGKVRLLNDQKKDIEANEDNNPDVANFNYIRKHNQALRLNTYAANLENRSDDFGYLSRIIENRDFNTNAAGSIRREINKDDVQKLIDFLKQPQNTGDNDDNQ